MRELPWVCLLAAAATLAVAAHLSAGPASAPASRPLTLPAVGQMPRKGLVALWSAEGNARDSAGASHGRLKNGAGFAPGRVGLAFKLDGKDDHVDFGNPKALQITGSQTIAMWIRPSRFDRNRYLYHKGFAGQGAVIVFPDGTIRYHYGPHADNTGRPYCWLSTGGVANVDAGHRPFPKLQTRGDKAHLKAGKWTHIAAVRDLKARKLCWYVNGRFLLECKAPYAQAGRGDYPLWIGRGPDYACFAGLIDEVAIWKRALGAAEVRAVFEAPSLGIFWLAAGPPHVRRVALADRIELNDGKALLGTVENERYTITSSVGKFEIPAGRVAAIAPVGKAGPDVWLMLADGQVLRGPLAEKVIRLELTTGSTLRIPLGRIRQLGYRITKDKPASPPPAGQMVLLRSGERLRWADAELKIPLQTGYGKIALPATSFLSVELSGLRHRVRFTNGSMLSGTLAAEKLKLRLQLGREVAIARERIVRLVGSAKPVAPPPGAATVTMRNGDRLLGRVTDKTLTIRTELGDAAMPPECVLTMTFDPAGKLTARSWDGSVLTGKLAGKTVSFSFATGGPALKLPVAQIASITRPYALPPPQTVKKIEKLIALLGAAAYADREQAEKQLIRIGAAAKPILERHLKDTDPEVRLRIRRILEKLAPPKPAPYPRKPAPFNTAIDVFLAPRGAPVRPRR